MLRFRAAPLAPPPAHSRSWPGAIPRLLQPQNPSSARWAPLTYSVRRVAGQLCKLANLTLVAVTLGAVAEALTLVKAGGGDPGAAREVLLGGFSRSRILEVQGERMIRRDFAPGGQIKNQIKDLDTILATAERFGVSMPLTSRIRELFVALRETHGETLDHSAIILQIEKMMHPATTPIQETHPPSPDTRQLLRINERFHPS